ncbi:MAG: hypothetical protein ABIP11_01095 [Luteimonas sp.]
MPDVTNATRDNPPSATRRPKSTLVAAVLVVVLILVLALRYMMQPHQVSSAILDRVGKALGLQITASGVSEYHLRGIPTLVVRNLVAREPGAKKPLLRADRILLSLPWSAIRARGAELVFDRIELDRPVIDLAALQHWLAQRPPGSERLPTLTHGLQIRDGNLVATDWSVTGLSLELPLLHAGQPVAAHFNGRYRSGAFQVPFALAMTLDKPAIHAISGLRVTGDISIEHDAWKIPASIILTGLLDSSSTVELRQARLSASAKYESPGSEPLPFALGLAGTLRDAGQQWQLAPLAIAIRGRNAIPNLDAQGSIALGNQFTLQLHGTLPVWPSAWPALPAPIAQSHSPLPFALRYEGSSDLTAPVTLQLRRDATTFVGRFQLAQLTSWMQSAANPSPLPPLQGHVSTPRLDIAGAKLQDVEITFDDPDVAAGPSVR